MFRSSRVFVFLGRVAILPAWLVLVCASAVLADADITTIALSGRPLPGFGNDIVTHTATFGDAVLNNHGQVAYSADLSGPGVEPKNRESYGRYTPGAGLELLARSFDPAPGRPDEHFFFMLGPVHINDVGNVQLRSHLVDATVTGARSGELGDWVWSPDGILKLAYNDEQTPVIGHYFQPIGSAINNRGQQFRSARNQPGGGDLPHSESLWLLEPGVEPKLVAKIGDPAPGLPSGITLATEFSGEFLDSGEILFRMGLAGPGVNANNNLAFWLDDGQGNLELIVREGTPAPGLPAGLAIDLTTFGGVQPLSSGALQVIGLLTGPGITSSNNVALWTYREGGLELLAREGDQAPSLPNGVVFERMFGPFQVIGPGIDSSNDTGIWLQQRDGFELVVREGERAPGTPDGVVFSSVDFFGTELFVFPGSSVQQNKFGQFSFMGFLKGPGVTDANDEGLWATDPDGVLRLIARQGQGIDVDDGPGVDMRTIESINVRNGDSVFEIFNDRGQVLFMATFTDGAKGLFLSNRVAVPEPSSGALAVICALAMFGPRRSARQRVRVVFKFTAILVVNMASMAFADDSVRTVAVSGQRAPGTPDGVVFGSFSPYGNRWAFELNNRGQVAFFGVLAGPGITPANLDGAWTEGRGNGLALVARGGDPAPGFPVDATFFGSGLGDLQFNDAGVTAIGEHILGGFWSDNGTDNLQLIARRQQPVPGIDSTTFNAGPEFSSMLNDVGQVTIGAFIGGFPGLLVHYPVDGYRILFQAPSGQAPGLADGILLDPSPLTNVNRGFLTNLGRYYFISRLVGPGVDSANNRAMWIEDSAGVYRVVVRTGDPAPGISGGVAVASFQHAFNDAGHYAFLSQLVGPGINVHNNIGIWTGAEGEAPQLVMRLGDHAPGTPEDVVFDFGDGFSDFTPWLFNNLGQVAFNASLSGVGVTDANDTGMWSSGNGAGLELVAREGDPAPGTGSGVVFGELVVNRSFTAPVTTNGLNNWGQMAFFGRLTGPGVTPANDAAIWAEDRRGILHLVVRTGDMLDADDGPGVDSRTIAALGAVDPLGNVAAYLKFNDLGQVLFPVIFTDGSSGIFVSNLLAVPEPGSIGLAVVGALAMLGSRRLARRRIGVLLSSAAVLLISMPVAALADGSVRTVALTGKQVPGLEPGVTFAEARSPSLNVHGQVAFASTLTGPGIGLSNRYAMWLHTPGSEPEMLARQGQQAPGAPEGINFDFRFDFLTQSPPQLNEAGEVGNAIHIGDSTGANRVDVNDHGTTNYGYWLWRAGQGMTKIVLGGELTPSLGHFFTGYDFYDVNDLGQHVHRAIPLPIPAGGQAESLRAESLWLLGPDAPPRLIARKGSPAPGLPSGVVFRGEEFAGNLAARVNNVGQAAFKMQVSGPGINSNNDVGYWMDDGLGNVNLIIREGGQAPGLPSGVTVIFPVVSFLNDAGHALLSGALQGSGVNSTNNSARWSSATGHGLELLVRTGDHAPGTASEVLFSFINGEADFNDAGQYAFEASLRGTGIDDGHRSGIWSQGGGKGLELVIREGDPAAGTEPGVVFDDSSSDEISNLTFNMSLNDSGQLAFDGYLRGPGVTSANNKGIWAQDRYDNLRLIARTGDLLDVDDGPGVDWRTIQSFELGKDFLNDRGQLVFRARFNDGSHGIFMSNLIAVPEPSSFEYLALVAVTAMRSRKRRVALSGHGKQSE